MSIRPDRSSRPRWPAPPGGTCGAKFLSAKVAISGANFGVAETGTLAVVESEGNGRMCLTLPETLITIMGIEKLVPRWRDLEVFLQLLPRSSTGERMNPYTSMWTGVTPGDGPQEFHLILLDNGRTAVLVRRGRPGRAELHPVQRLPERLPGVRAGRRARVRVGLSGPDRGDPVAAADRDRGQRLACRTRRRSAAPATTSVRSRSTFRRSWSTCGPAHRGVRRRAPDRRVRGGGDGGPSAG